jgi:uncharacterized protein YbcI
VPYNLLDIHQNVNNAQNENIKVFIFQGYVVEEHEFAAA